MPKYGHLFNKKKVIKVMSSQAKIGSAFDQLEVSLEDISDQESSLLKKCKNKILFDMFKPTDTDPPVLKTIGS